MHRRMSAFGGKADITRVAKCPLATQSDMSRVRDRKTATTGGACADRLHSISAAQKSGCYTTIAHRRRLGCLVGHDADGLSAFAYQRFAL